MHLHLSQTPRAFWHSVNVNILPSIYKQLNEVCNSRTNQNIPKMREFHEIESKRKCNFVNYRCCVKMMFFRNSKFCFSNFASGFLFLFTGKQTRLFTRKIALAIGHLQLCYSSKYFVSTGVSNLTNFNFEMTRSTINTLAPSNKVNIIVHQIKKERFPDVAK